MAAEKYAYGIASVKFGTPTGSATMPQSLTAWAQTVKGSLTISEAESQTKKFHVEETTTPVKEVVSDAGALSVKWRAYDITPSLVEIVKGGTAGSGTGVLTYAGPTSVAAKELALEITTTNGVVWNIYKCSILARFDSAISAEQLLEMEVSGTALDPGSNASPYGYTVPNPA
jgi:hypothetical protein